MAVEEEKIKNDVQDENKKLVERNEDLQKQLIAQNKNNLSL